MRVPAQVGLRRDLIALIRQVAAHRGDDEGRVLLEEAESLSMPRTGGDAIGGESRNGCFAESVVNVGAR